MPTLFNQETDLVENYKGHIELLDDNDATYYKPDLLMDWSVSTIVDTEKTLFYKWCKEKINNRKFIRV